MERKKGRSGRTDRGTNLTQNQMHTLRIRLHELASDLDESEPLFSITCLVLNGQHRVSLYKYVVYVTNSKSRRRPLIDIISLYFFRSLPKLKNDDGFDRSLLRQFRFEF